VAYFCTLPGPMQHAVADMLEDREWYVHLNFRYLGELLD
jgi:hypothetical protein